MESGNNAKKRLVLNKKNKRQTDSKHTQLTLCVESEFMENVEECLDARTPEKYIISNFDETSETENSDTDDELMSL